MQIVDDLSDRFRGQALLLKTDGPVELSIDTDAPVNGGGTVTSEYWVVSVTDGQPDGLAAVSNAPGYVMICPAEPDGSWTPMNEVLYRDDHNIQEALEEFESMVR